jgi:hypothetical protein
MGSSIRNATLAAMMIWPGLAVAADAPAPAASLDEPWQGVINNEARYISWHSSGGNSGIVPGIGMGGGTGQQLYLPTGLQLGGRIAQDFKVEFLLRGGEIWSRQRTTTGTVEFFLPTDTLIGASATYLGWAGIQPFAALNVNLPTGRSIINGSSSNTKMDSELVPTPVFGEGLNVGPTVGVNLPINESLIVTLATGYTNRGVYDRVFAFSPPSAPPVHYDPGDVLTFNGAIGYRGERATVQLSASYSIESTTLVNDLSAKAGYAWTDNWASRLIVQYGHTGRDLIVQFPAPGLVRERANSNGDVYRITGDTTYSKDNYSVGPTAGLLFRARNGYESTAPEFMPQRLGWTAGGVASYKASPQFSLNARLEYLRVRQNDKPTELSGGIPVFGTEIPAVLTTGWLGSIAGVLRF